MLMAHDTTESIAAAAIERARRKYGKAWDLPITAQILPTVSPQWYVITIVPEHENIASGHLVGRGFGVFDPFGMIKMIVRGKVRLRHQRLLPGYLLVFVWDVEQQKARIRACPGVLDILRYGNGRAVTVADDLVNYLQAKEISRSAGAMDWARELGIDPATPLPIARAKAEKSKKRKKKLYKNKKKGRRPVQREAVAVAPPQAPVEIATIRPYSALEGIEDLVASERISLFNRAIGLGS